ncbi:MAG TPA: response regulator, partial [Pseudomonadota bacterium]|nr:response regulator [Pseudomonadota bacterium]
MSAEEPSHQAAATPIARILFLPMLVLLVGLCVSAWQAAEQRSRNHAFLRTATEHETEILRENIREAFTQASLGLRGTRGTISALGGNITSEQFRTYVRSRHLLTEFPGIRGFGLADKVPSDRIDLYQAQVREQEGHDFTIYHLGPPDPSNIYVVRFVEPSEQNKNARGLNVGSEARRLQAAQMAVDLGEMTVTSQIKLVQDEHKTPGVLMYVPVYHGLEHPDSVELRRSRLRGLIYAPIVIAELLYAKANASIAKLCIAMYEVGDPDPWFIHPASPSHDGCDQETITTKLSIGTRELVLYTSLPKVRAAVMTGTEPLVVLAFGVSLSCALSAIGYLLLSSRERAQGRAHEMTLAYRQTNLELQSALKATEEVRRRLSHILDATLVGTWEWNVQTGDTICNERWAQMLGYTLAELSPVTLDKWSALVHPTDGKRARELLDKHFLRESEMYEHELRLRHKNGSWIWVHERGQVTTWTEDGKPLQMFGTQHEITDRKRATSDVELFKTMIERANDPFFLIDIEAGARMIYVNEAAQKHFGFPRETIYTWCIPDWDPDVTDADVPKLIAQLEAAKSIKLRSRHRTASGVFVPVDISVNYVEDEQGRRLSYGWFRDITERIETERLHAEAKDKAEFANQAKSAFLAMMSHEIRTPLNALIGTAYLLGQTDLSEKQRADLKTIDAAGKSLLALINNVLDFSKIEAGELMLDPHAFLLPEILDDLRSMFARLAAEKGLNFFVPELDATIPSALMGDGNRLRQCLVNLVGNAIKFTQRGAVTLAVYVANPDGSTDPKQVRLRFVVSDTGLGMSRAQLGRIFQPFSQADVSTTRRYGGSGLGLSIVKRLAELMNGTVGVESTEGVGSRFWLELPFAVSSVPPSHLSGQIVTRPLHVLVAEDNSSDRALFVKMAADFGWAVEGTTNGQEMIERVVERVAQKNPVDCVVLDWRMPQMDGLEAMKELRKQLGSAPMPSVIMVTAADRGALLSSLSDPRPDSVLTKPLSQSALFNAINNAVVAHGMKRDHLLGLTRIGADHGRWLPGVRVLVVDDSRLNLDVIGRVLQREGAVAILRESGWDALETLDTIASELDAVLMDLQMPDLDGCETTKRIRANPDWASLLVIALTAGATEQEQQRAKDAGMDDFLTKPIDPIKLVRVLRRHIQHRRNRIIPVEPLPEQTAIETLPMSPPSSSPPSLPVAPSGFPTIAGFDMVQASEVLGDPDILKQLMGPFQVVIPLRMNTQRSTNGTKVAVGYVRVSTQEQVSEGVSLDAQRDKLKAYCKCSGIKLIDIKADEGLSGGTLERPGLQAALAMLRRGTANTLIVV